MGKIMLNDMIFITRHGACPHEYEFDQNGEHVDLLETLAYRIGNKLIETYPSVEKVKVEVRKMQPPIANFNGTAAVSLTVTR